MISDDVDIELGRSISKRDGKAIREICRRHPEIVTDHMADPDGNPNARRKEAWTCFAVGFGWESLESLLDAGFNIDATNMPEGVSVISLAIGRNDMEMVRKLLARGADPNIGRPVIVAMNRDKKELRLPLVRLLVEHGLEVNTLYDLYGDMDKAFTALDWAGEGEIAEFLRERGAKTADEVRSVPPTPQAPSARQEVIDHFTTTHGPVEKRALIEIVPGDAPIAIHSIRPAGNRKHFTLFTTGISERPMTTPPGKDEFALVELYIQLPGDWKVEDLRNSQWNWPIRWLQKTGNYPYAHGTWLGGPLTVVANDDPPKPLAPDTRMTCLLLLADGSFKRRDGKTVQLMRITPLYTEERDLELREGSPALMRKLDRAGVPFIVDVKRPNTI